MSYQKVNLSMFGFTLTMYCNLNCRNCADCMPWIPKCNYDFQNLKKDFLRSLEYIDSIDEMLIGGGETLLYPWLIDVIELCASVPQVNKIIMVTNGTIKPSKELLQACRDYHVIVRISGYSKEVVPNREEVISDYEDYDLQIQDLNGMIWYSMGDNSKRERTEQELRSVFKTCIMKNCVSLYPDGKIYTCSRQYPGSISTMYPTPQKNEYIDVRSAADLAKQFKDFIELDYLSTCDYCDGISCATKAVVPTAAQILPQEEFLKLKCIYAIYNEENTDEGFQDLNNQLLNLFKRNQQSFAHIRSYEIILYEISNFPLSRGINEIIIQLEKLITFLEKDYIQF